MFFQIYCGRIPTTPLEKDDIHRRAGCASFIHTLINTSAQFKVRNMTYRTYYGACAGNIPKELGALGNLKFLRLSSNMLIGETSVIRTTVRLSLKVFPILS